MNYLDAPERLRVTDKDKEETHPPQKYGKKRPPGSAVLAVCAFALLTGGLSFGAWRYTKQHREVATIAEQQRDFVPSVRIQVAQPNTGYVTVTLPATTSPFTAANLFARSSGYIDKRNVDIGDHVKEGQLLVQIVAPELDHQIAQAEATLAQLKAAAQQAVANKDLAQVTWDRDRPLVNQGWVTPQQGTVDQQTLKAQEAAVAVANANVTAQQAQLQVLYQQKAYQRVVAPFSGVITQRNVDIGSLVQADATSGTFLFTIQQSDVVRTQVYVPQDEAFGLVPGVEAVMHVPEIPGRTFPGKVTRIADALQPGTRTLLTEVDIPNPDGILTAGAYCTIELHIPRKTPSILLSADAVIFNSNGLQVAVIENGVARIRKITVARDFGKEVEVRDGVKPGDKVILNPPVSLVDGSGVRARAPAH